MHHSRPHFSREKVYIVYIREMNYESYDGGTHKGNQGEKMCMRICVCVSARNVLKTSKNFLKVLNSSKMNEIC